MGRERLREALAFDGDFTSRARQRVALSPLFAPGDIGRSLGIANHHVVVGLVEETPASEVAQGVGQRFSGGADHLGQLLLGQPGLDEGARGFKNALL